MVPKPTELVTRRHFATTFAGVVLAGCSGGGGSEGAGGSTSTATTTQTPTETASPEPTATPTTTPTEEADVTIEVGPDGNYLSFVPTRVRLSVGDTVKWVFKSSGHNVCGHPSDNPKVEIPDGAEPFGSHPPDNAQGVDQPGSTYTHTFDTKGEYTYVCILHAHNGMIGHLTVR